MKIELTKKQLLALKAVFYGCNTNKKFKNATYMIDGNEIKFINALEIVDEIINKCE